MCCTPTRLETNSVCVFVGLLKLQNLASVSQYIFASWTMTHSCRFSLLISFAAYFWSRHFYIRRVLWTGNAHRERDDVRLGCRTTKLHFQAEMCGLKCICIRLQNRMVHEDGKTHSQSNRNPMLFFWFLAQLAHKPNSIDMYRNSPSIPRWLKVWMQTLIQVHTCQQCLAVNMGNAWECGSNCSCFPLSISELIGAFTRERGFDPWSRWL